MNRTTLLLRTLICCAGFTACGTTSSQTPSTGSYLDDPQPQCFLGDAIAAGVRLGAENAPEDAGELDQSNVQPHRGLERQGVVDVVQAHVGEVRYCYEQGLALDSKLKGRVLVRFTVGRGGKVRTSAVASSTLPDKNVEACVARAVCRWLFEVPPNNRNVTVSYPFELEPHVASVTE
ncbi:MAG: AgmX/PglI C-terminal domain-containing protein [Deltaproteobacteria bacterium]|nr:AgmX/PglI C-terminal domain-containing protein [Deltaproteobacteria bacterium]